MMFGSGGAPSVDAPLSAQQQQSRISTFQAQGPLRLPGVSSADQAAAIRTLALPVSDQQALERDIQFGQVRLVSVTLWDDMVEDGDVVEVISGGFNKTVALTKARQTIFVPVPASNMVQIRGVRDGGGGITVATATSGGALPIPVLAPGQVVSVPVAR